ncbi:hypothetical protein QBC40DRAFT_284568 [Triangularia verruculosa]|uniref:Uncharacterized protein n=1 Tax=Triangularia verruculosa TaxID=2587418 RepID=A0AAN7AR36_9PEZI|nr:hypothetical protein QBC40DRAFT_284568 [Triangularia verruculosa]
MSTPPRRRHSRFCCRSHRNSACPFPSRRRHLAYFPPQTLPLLLKCCVHRRQNPGHINPPALLIRFLLYGGVPNPAGSYAAGGPRWGCWQKTYPRILSVFYPNSHGQATECLQSTASGAMLRSLWPSVEAVGRFSASVVKGQTHKGCCLTNNLYSWNCHHFSATLSLAGCYPWLDRNVLAARHVRFEPRGSSSRLLWIHI